MMKVFPLTACLFFLPLVYGDRAERIQQIINDIHIDANGDGLMSVEELNIEFARVDVNSDWVVTKAEFMDTQTGWPSFYGDSQETTEAFFNNLDVACIKLFSGSILSGCGRLGIADLTQHYEAMDPDGDQIVSVSQAIDWLDSEIGFQLFQFCGVFLTPKGCPGHRTYLTSLQLMIGLSMNIKMS